MHLRQLAALCLAFVWLPGTDQGVADPRKDIAAAVSRAAKDGKHVLLNFGADWCADCRVLSALLEDPKVTKLVETGFHVVRIEVGYRDQNMDLAAEYESGAAKWIPALVVLDGKGTRLTSLPVMTVTRRTTADELVEHLRPWAPKRAPLPLADFTERAVRVTITLERAAGDAAIVAAFEPLAPEFYLYGKDLPAAGLSGVGRPTRIAIVSQGGAQEAGPIAADQPVRLDRLEALSETFPIYPPGRVVLRLPVRLPEKGNGRTDLRITYQTCGPEGCQPPVENKRITVTLPVGK